LDLGTFMVYKIKSLGTITGANNLTWGNYQLVSANNPLGWSKNNEK
jgi:hypothetical protein